MSVCFHSSEDEAGLRAPPCPVLSLKKPVKKEFLVFACGVAGLRCRATLPHSDRRGSRGQPLPGTGDAEGALCS